jgi:5-hydroxyisourate hydrolase-like protein (transthyretin family)
LTTPLKSTTSTRTCGQGAAVGSLSTDDDGRFDGAVVIPRDFGLGEYRLRLETPGDARCRAGRSK